MADTNFKIYRRRLAGNLSSLIVNGSSIFCGDVKLDEITPKTGTFITVNGSACITGDIIVDILKAKNEKITINDSLCINGDLIINGNTNITIPPEFETLQVSGTAVFCDDVYLDTLKAKNEKITIDDSLCITGNLTVDGSTNLNILQVSGTAVFCDDVYLDTLKAKNEKMTIDDSLCITGNLTVDGSTNLNILQVSGTATFCDDTEFNNLIVLGPAVFCDNVELDILKAKGEKITIDDSLCITGNLIVDGSINIDFPTDFETLQVSGTAVFCDDVYLDTLKAKGEKITIDDSLCISGNLIVNGTITGTVATTSEIHTMWFNVNIDQSGVPKEFKFTGTCVTFDDNITGNTSATFSIHGNHFYLVVNSITTGGTVSVSGYKVDEETGAITFATEMMTISDTAPQTYQSTNKWLEVTSIDVSGVTGINYDYGELGYTDMRNKSIQVKGYRLESLAGGNSNNLNLCILKVQDDGTGKVSIVTIENLTIDDNGSAQIIDTARSGSRNYTSTSGNFWDGGSLFVWKQNDFDSYFSSDENVINTATKNEGLIVRVRAPNSTLGGANGPVYVSLQIDYVYI